MTICEDELARLGDVNRPIKESEKLHPSPPAPPPIHSSTNVQESSQRKITTSESKSLPPNKPKLKPLITNSASQYGDFTESLARSNSHESLLSPSTLRKNRQDSFTNRHLTRKRSSSFSDLHAVEKRKVVSTPHVSHLKKKFLGNESVPPRLSQDRHRKSCRNMKSQRFSLNTRSRNRANNRKTKSRTRKPRLESKLLLYVPTIR